MTPPEEKLVLDLHSKWGNRWSRIARKIPGRTDNEIKNYWRTHMRKKAQERKKSALKPSSSSSSNSSSSSCISNTSNAITTTKEQSFYDTGGLDMIVPVVPGEKKTGLEVEETNKAYSLDEIWKEIDMSEDNSKFTRQTMASPLWDFVPTIDEYSLLWPMDQDQNNFNSLPLYNNHMSG